MIGVARLFFLYFIVNSIRIVLLVSIRELSTNDIIIDVNKGYTLRRLGAYSPNVVEQIVHTFIPLDDFCVASPKTDVCLYASLSKKINVVELATMMTSRQTVHTLSSYDSDSVSRLTGKDIIRVLMQHNPNEIIKNTKSIVHFVNNQFHYQKSDEKGLKAASPTNAIDNYFDIPRLRPTSAEMIIKQISRNKISFEYLSQTDLELFLAAIFSTIDTSYTISNLQESLDTFVQFVVGQSVFALRYCSLDRQNSLSTQPCLAISTLLLQIPADGTSKYSIYRLIPLPIICNGHKYVYSNLPKVIGINYIDQTVIMWNDESDINECAFSPVVQCQKIPVSMSLSKSSCLSQLFDDNQLATSMCQVSRSQNIDQDVIYIDNGIWLFHNIHNTHYCQVYSTSNGLSETISITEAALIRIPCNRTITCMNVQLPASSCTQRRVIITPSFASYIRNLPSFILPINNMTQTIVSSYQLQLEHSMKEMITAFTSKQSRFERIMHDFATYILSVVCFIFFIIFIYIIKFIKYKVQREINNLESLVRDIISV
jgi:hypothetical protein